MNLHCLCFNLIHKQKLQKKKQSKNHRVLTLFKLEFVPVIFQVHCKSNTNACLSRSRLFGIYLHFERGVLFALYRATR